MTKTARINKYTKQLLVNFQKIFEERTDKNVLYYQFKIDSKPTYVGFLKSNKNFLMVNVFQANKYIENLVFRKTQLIPLDQVSYEILEDKIIICKNDNPENKLVFHYNKVINLENYYQMEEKKTMNNEMNNSVVTNEVVNTPAPVIPTEAYADTDSVTAPSMVATASEPITNVADFLAMVHGSRTTGIADGRVKLSLAEVIERLGGTVTVQKVEQCTNEGRNFYVVQLSEQTYMYSFKMMTTIIAKWVQACGGVENLNNMLSQTEIKMKLSKSEYNGKSYTRCDII